MFERIGNIEYALQRYEEELKGIDAEREDHKDSGMYELKEKYFDRYDVAVLKSRIAVLSKKKGDNEKAERFYKDSILSFEKEGDFGYLAHLAGEMEDNMRKNTYSSLAKILK